MRILTILLGIALIIFSCGWFLRTTMLLRGGREVPGEIVEIRREKVSPSDREPPGHFVTFRFQDQQGQTHVIKPNSGLGSYARYSPGDKIKVIYPEANPEDATIRAWDSLWAFPALVCAAGIGLLCKGRSSDEDD